MYRLPIKKGENLMKKYMSPEMEMMDFMCYLHISATLRWQDIALPPQTKE